MSLIATEISRELDVYNLVYTYECSQVYGAFRLTETGKNMLKKDVSGMSSIVSNFKSKWTSLRLFYHLSVRKRSFKWTALANCVKRSKA